MNKELIFNADTCYRLAEQKAEHYFASLYTQVTGKTYVSDLIEDIQLWKQHHIRRGSWLSFISRGKRTSNTTDYYSHIQWLKHTGKLDDYLDRSISYIYMRDLGKAMDSPHTYARIQRVAADVKQRMIRAAEDKQGEPSEFISLVELYRWAQKENVETAVIWALGKLRNVAANIPEGMNAEHAQRKLIKIIVGVVLHASEELTDEHSPEERARILDEAIRLGYSYGLTYPFIDDLLDAQVLTVEEKAQYSDIIRAALCTGSAPRVDEWTGENKAMMQYIYAELTEAFEYIKHHQGEAQAQHKFFEQAYVFFHSQELDRAKNLSHTSYTNEELFIPIILKSASSRLIARSVIRAPLDEGFEERTFFYGIYNQLADDFADMFDDMKDGAVTPYTYYLTYRDQRSDLINPFELYWAVIYYLIHNVYQGNTRSREVIVSRAINGLKRFKARVGTEQYNRTMDIFASGNSAFNRLIQRLVRKADDVDFFDKLLRDQLIVKLKNERALKQQFIETIKTSRDQINSTLQIAKLDGMPPMKETLIDAANYSLVGDAKRLRPILAWVMGVQEYGLEPASIIPLLRSIEYMHTASLIFDDLPSQDNAPIRRGRSTLHHVHDSATAELTGLFLIQKAIQEQASLHKFDVKAVLDLIQYSAQTAEELCTGQAMDLSSKGKAMTLEQLNTICFYKTGIAFEAALVMPSILAKVSEREIKHLKTFAYHAGIAFQIQDDLLDLEGDAHLLGKATGQDALNNTSTFVTILGQEGAKKEMWQHYCLAMEALQELPRRTAFLQHLLNYIIHRDR